MLRLKKWVQPLWYTHRPLATELELRSFFNFEALFVLQSFLRKCFATNTAIHVLRPLFVPNRFVRPFSSTWRPTILYTETVNIAVDSFSEDRYRWRIYRHALILLVDLNIAMFPTRERINLPCCYPETFIKRDHIPLFSFSWIFSNLKPYRNSNNNNLASLSTVDLYRSIASLPPNHCQLIYIYLLAFEPGLRGLWYSISKRTVVTPTKTGGEYCMFKL